MLRDPLIMHNTLPICIPFTKKKYSQKSGFTQKIHLNCQNAPIFNHFVEKYKFLLVGITHRYSESDDERKLLKRKALRDIFRDASKEQTDLYFT